MLYCPWILFVLTLLSTNASHLPEHPMPQALKQHPIYLGVVFVDSLNFRVNNCLIN